MITDLGFKQLPQATYKACSYFRFFVSYSRMMPQKILFEVNIAFASFTALNQSLFHIGTWGKKAMQI